MDHYGMEPFGDYRPFPFRVLIAGTIPTAAGEAAVGMVPTIAPERTQPMRYAFTYKPVEDPGVESGPEHWALFETRKEVDLFAWAFQKSKFSLNHSARLLELLDGWFDSTSAVFEGETKVVQAWLPKKRHATGN